MSRVNVYSTGTCSICDQAKSLLDKWNIDFTDKRIDTDDALLKEFSEATQGARTVPQIVIEGELIGGFAELTEMHMDGGLDHLMAEA
ncbi:MAG: glutaredoxin family protein [Proteobacteria bacterium]|nr:glutaredoxin family protein [Pseudomonadota bacterium]